MRVEVLDMKLLLRVLINAAALWVAASFVPGIQAGGFGSVLALAIVFGVVNAFVRPFLKLLSCPIILLTLGLFTLVLNALMLMFAAWIGRQLGIDFSVSGFWAAFFGALLVSIVSTLLSILVTEVETPT
jgi:putative membrane protein